MRVTSSGFCLWVIVNGKPLNLEKTTFSVLSVLLYIYNPILDIETIKGTNKVNLIRIEEILRYSYINQYVSLLAGLLQTKGSGPFFF